MNKKHQKWLDEFCNETISSEDFAEFEEEILANREFREEVRAYVSLDAQLRSGAEPSFDAAEFLCPTPQPVKHSRRFLMPGLIVAGLFSVLLMLGLAMWRAEAENPSTGQGVAVIASQIDAVWASGGHSSGDILSQGHLELSSGLTEIRFYNGASVLIEAPAHLKLESESVMTLTRGKLRAQVPEVARGFTIRTEAMTIVDLGTEFGLEIDPIHGTDLRVFTGEVEVHPIDGQRSSVIVEGHALEWSREGVMISPSTTKPFDLVSFDEFRERSKSSSKQGLLALLNWEKRLLQDPRLAVYYPFDTVGDTLIDRSPQQRNGTLVGTHWKEGRWPGRQALSFDSPADRVRLEIPEAFDALTLMMWVQLDPLPGRNQHILHPDHYDEETLQWTLQPEGHMSLSVSSQDHATDSAFVDGENIGQWTHITASYDGATGDIALYVNGEETARNVTRARNAVTIGRAAIGNWGVAQEEMTGRGVRNITGDIDHFMVWKAALSTAEIREIYESTRP